MSMFSLLLPTFFLFLFGFFNLLGIRPSLAYTHLFNFVVSVIGFLVIRKIGKRFFYSNTRFFYWLFIGILIVTYIIGFEVKGSKRWIDLIIFNFQASEFFKIFFILFFARFFSKNFKLLDRPRTFFYSIFYFVLPTVIIFKQPDLGTALVYMGIFLVILFFSGVPKRYMLIFLILVSMCTPLMWILMKEYQRIRLVSFFNPMADQQGNAYNMIQAMITIGSGKLFGKGLGLGTQTRLLFLPENHTDFAFSSLVEQFGFLGGFIAIFLYGSIIVYLIRKVTVYFNEKTEEGFFSFYYCLGFLSFVLIQVCINIGMNLGIFPVAGIALPLISYGGSSVVAWMLGLALLP